MIADRIHQRLTRNRIARPAATALAHDIEAEEEDGRTRLARREMADEEEARLARLNASLISLTANSNKPAVGWGSHQTSFRQWSRRRCS